ARLPPVPDDVPPGLRAAAEARRVRPVRRRALPARGRSRRDRAAPPGGLCATDGTAARLLPPAEPPHDRRGRGPDRLDPAGDPPGGGGGATIAPTSPRGVGRMRQ